MARSRLTAIAIGALAGAVTPAAAQDWPTRPVVLVVPFAAGGPADAVGRILASGLSESLGHEVIVENIGGGGGMVGSARVAKAAPDGYQFVLGNMGTHAANQTFYKTPLYNAATDFAPVTLVAETPLLLLARKDLPADDIAQFIPYARANQAKMQFGSGGAGSASHLACMLVNLAVGITVTHVPYRGAAPAMQDVAASNWFAVFAPKGTPARIVAKLNAAVGAAMDAPAMQARMRDIGADIPAPERRTPAYLQTFVEAEIAKWAAPIKASGAIVE
jgi:tripartite-type tricarboxylate transporter receptor subunit TctC